MGYLTVDEVLTLTDNTDLEPERLMLLIESSSAAIDNFCRRSFSTTAKVLSFAYQDPSKIRFKYDLAQLVEVSTNSGQVFAPDDVTMLPVLGPPYSLICLNKSARFQPDTDGIINVSGYWGYHTVIPAPIKLACQLLITWELSKFDLGAVSGVNAPGSLGVNFTSESEGIPVHIARYLRPYRKVRIDAWDGPL